jgi:hypothetical protein
MLSSLKIKCRVSDGLNELILRNEEFRKFYYYALNSGSLYMIGGAVRDFAIRQIPRDLDLIIDCKPEILHDLMKEFSYKINRFGGYKLKVNNIEVDIWSIHKHWAFKESLYECTFENISKGAFFNFDAITINLNNYDVDADTFIDSYENGVLDLNLNERHVNLNPNPMKNVERAFEIKESLNFKFTNRLKEYCDRWGEGIKARNVSPPSSNLLSPDSW